MGLALSAMLGGGGGGGGGGGDTQAVSFADMPVWGDTSVSVSHYISYGTLGIFNMPTSRVIRNATAFNAAMLTIGAWVTTAAGANTWTTVFSTTGTKGKLFNVIPQLAVNTGIVVEIEVTIDGNVWVYSFLQGTEQFTPSKTGFLGDALWTPNVSPTITTAIMNHPVAVELVGQYPTIMSPWSAFQQGNRYLQWTDSMQVRTRCIGAGQNGTEQQKASCSFMYDV